ncbi:MAG: polysaccharide lyase 6 family protein [Aquisalinus sp.]|nr:polysaccharide lyase 6 family protein [Aquisalinus sp.]
MGSIGSITHAYDSPRVLGFGRYGSHLAAILIACLLSSFFSLAQAKEIIVTTQEEYAQAVKNAEPGDEIVLVNGIWKNFEILFTGVGKPNKPITLRAEDRGRVIISGQSNLRLAGKHLVVDGLVFRDGYSPTSSVISFRRAKGDLAYNSRVTQVVIDEFNNPERFEVDYWVSLYGQNNRFDHNHLSGKNNKGVTLAVRLDSKESLRNNHRIDHNYFGPREVLGSNGGETLRIGTSKYSLEVSSTLVENNYFDRCDGELEIISVKSGENIVRGNVFYESSGTLTLRHGNNNIIEGNVFFGNGKDHTGGIRVINKGQVIRNNYMEGLTGYRFAGALVVMNGVPDSPINRYHQVEDAIIERNSIVNSDHIQLAAGSDQERSAVPVSTIFTKNFLYHEDGRELFTVYDDITGITFSENVMHAVDAPLISDGTSYLETLRVSRGENGLLYPVGDSAVSAGVSSDLSPIARDKTGVAWYPKPDKSKSFGFGKIVSVQNKEGALEAAVNQAAPGDILELEDGAYVISKVLGLDKPLTIRSSSVRGAVITYSRSALFEIQDGGKLRLDGIVISGRDAPDNVGNSVIRTVKRAMLKNYEIEIVNSSIKDLDVNKAYDVVSVEKGTLADKILIEDSSFSNVSGNILRLNAENDNYGIYNADYVILEGNTFRDIGETIVNLYRGGTDESTFGPHFSMSRNVVHNVGYHKQNSTEASILLHGVQVSDISSNEFHSSKPLKVNHTVSEPRTSITGNKFVETTSPLVVELYSEDENTAFISGNTYEAAP